MHDSINIIIQPHRYHQDSLPALSFTNKESFRPTYSQLGIATPFRDPPVFLSLSLSLPYILNSDHLPRPCALHYVNKDILCGKTVVYFILCRRWKTTKSLVIVSKMGNYELPITTKGRI